MSARRVALLVPTALLLGLAVVLALSNGGYSPTNWYPAALFVLALLAVLVSVGAARWTSWVRRGLMVYGLFVAWSYLSILWADLPALAWDGANRSLLYGGVLAIVTMRAWSPGELRVAMGVIVGVCTALALGTITVGASSDVTALFLEGRLAEPLGYANATPNLWLLACFPALWLAIDRNVPWWCRGAVLAAGAFLAQASLLSQSRGVIAAFMLVALVFVVVSPRRWPALGTVVVVVGATAASSGPVLAVHDATVPDKIGGLLTDARLAIVLVSLGVLALGLLAAWADARLERHGRATGNTRRGNASMAGLAVVVCIAGLVAVGNPVAWVDDRWADFKTSGYSEVDRPGQTRLTGSLGSQRYDVYRVALREFRENPIQGVGADNFGPGYLLEGETDQNPRYAHSLIMSLLAETGAIGTLLFAGFLFCMVAAMRRVRHTVAGARGPVLGAASGAAMFLTGAMFDWLWQFPALAMFGFLLMGMASSGPVTPATPEATTTAAPEPGAPGDAWSIASVARRLAVGLLVLAAGISLILPGIAERFTVAAYDIAATDPRLAVQRLDRAADLNRLSAQPLLTKNVILRRYRDFAGAHAALDEAAEREPRNWFIPFERALLESEEGDFDAALALLRQAKELNPRQVVIDLVIKETAAGDRYGADRAESQLVQQTARKLKPTG